MRRADCSGSVVIDGIRADYTVWTGPAFQEYELVYLRDLEGVPVEFIHALKNSEGHLEVDEKGDINRRHVNQCVEYLNMRYGIELPEVL